MDSLARSSEIVAALLAQAADAFDAVCGHSKGISPTIGPWSFSSASAPSISLREYFVRMERHLHCSPSCFVLAFIYIDRILLHSPSLRLSGLNVHR